MDANEYLKNYLEFVHSKLSTASREDLIGTACFGLGGEAGEFIDLIKKVKYQGKELDRAKAIKELGDLVFYWAVACIALDATANEVIDTNVEKLSARYPDGFTVQNSEVRKEGDV